MEYLVLETHEAYAVVLDEKGRMLKTANLGFEVGEKIHDVIPLKYSSGKSSLKRQLAVLAASAACICIIYFGAVKPYFVPYGSVRMTINPDVLMTVSQSGKVLKLEGLNDDGSSLISGYKYKDQQEPSVAANLMKRASEFNYLKNDGTVKLVIDSKDKKWSENMGGNISKRMNDGIVGKNVTIFICYDEDNSPETVITTNGYSHKTYSYDEWKSDIQGVNSHSIKEWGEQTADTMEQWGEETGEWYEQWGESVGDIFDDGFDGASDINALFGKIKELFS